MKAGEVDYFCSLAMPEFTTMQTMPEGTRYVIDVVHWPGCRAAGRTRDEAAEALKLAKREWLITRSKQRLEVPLPTNVTPQLHTLEAAVEVSKQIALNSARDNGVALAFSLDELAAINLYELVGKIITTAASALSTHKPRQQTRRARTAARN